MKKIISLVLALCMVLTIGATFAEDQTPRNNVTADGSVSITGLDAGDQVNLFQIIQWYQNTGWDYTEAVKTAAADLGKTLPDLEKITGKYIDNPDTTVGGKVFQQGQISVGDAATFASLASSLTAIDGGTADSSKSITKSIDNTGLYMALVTPANPETLYNPIFVAADYKDNATNSQEAVLTTSYSPTAMAKKETVTLTKEIDNNENFVQQAVNAGDEVQFTITSKVPAFSGAYVDPQYVITDTTEVGLNIISEHPTVTITGITLEASDYTDSITTNANAPDTLTVSLTSAGLAKVAATGLAQTITVTYKAQLVDIDALTVTEKDNEATVKFSNNPGDSSSYSLLEDKTKTYSFSIDSRIFGYTGSDYITNELVKIGIGPDGKLLTDTQEYHSGTDWTSLSPLQGAEFKLYKSYANNELSQPYSNPKFNGTVSSDSNGLLNIVGLDEGTYYLAETTAPAGYVKDNRVFEITIDADYTKIDGDTYKKNVGTEDAPVYVNVRFDSYYVLKSYSVTVKDAATGTAIATSDYSFTNKGPVDHADLRTDFDANGFAGDDETAISNTQGVELPSTGGIGTTIFYILGGVLVIGAAVILIARRKAQD